MRPPAIWLNIFGNVKNINDGPASGSILNEKHAGIIISPDIVATNVSRIVIFNVSPARERFLSR